MKALVGLAVVLAAFGPAGPALAQEPTPVVGTADFRNPPRLTDGQYIDTIVTGETVWYAVLYTNGEPYRFEASLPDVDLGSNPDLSLDVSFVGPTLGSVGEGPGLVEGPGASYLSGHTNSWFVTIELATSGRLGLEYRVLLDIDGVEDTGFHDCTSAPDCTFDDDLNGIVERTALVTADLADVRRAPTAAVAQLEVDNLRGQLETAETLHPGAEARLAAAEARIAALCGGATDCDLFPDPGTTTPIWAWVLGAAAFAGGGTRAARKYVHRGE